MVIFTHVHVSLTIIGMAIEIIVRIGFLENNVAGVLLIFQDSLNRRVVSSLLPYFSTQSLYFREFAKK